MPRAGKDPVEVSGDKGAVPVYRLSTEGGGYVGWSDGGRTIVWGMGNTIYRQDLGRAREAILKKTLAEKEKEKAGEGKEGEAGGAKGGGSASGPPKPRAAPG